jgi:membrane protein DedA with SNARE-associated domain
LADPAGLGYDCPALTSGVARLLSLLGLTTSLAASALLARADSALLSSETWRPFGYLGVLALSLVASCLPAAPVPLLPMVFLAGRVFEPLPVALVAAAGMTAGELLGYAVGAGACVGRPRAAQPERLRAVSAAWRRRLHDRHGPVALAILAFIPNPAFKLVAAAAGAARMPLWRFVAAVGAGRLAKALALAYAGHLATGGTPWPIG